MVVIMVMMIWWCTFQ